MARQGARNLPQLQKAHQLPLAPPLPTLLHKPARRHLMRETRIPRPGGGAGFKPALQPLSENQAGALEGPGRVWAGLGAATGAAPP